MRYGGYGVYVVGGEGQGERERHEVTSASPSTRTNTGPYREGCVIEAAGYLGGKIGEPDLDGVV